MSMLQSDLWNTLGEALMNASQAFYSQKSNSSAQIVKKATYPKSPNDHI